MRDVSKRVQKAQVQAGVQDLKFVFFHEYTTEELEGLEKIHGDQLRIIQVNLVDGVTHQERVLTYDAFMATRDKSDNHIKYHGIDPRIPIRFEDEPRVIIKDLPPGAKVEPQRLNL